MVERGKDHLGAPCVVAASLAERACAVMDRGMPYVICDTDGTPVDAGAAKAVIAEHWTVSADVRARRRSKRTTRGGRPPGASSRGHSRPCARGDGERGDPPLHQSSARAS